MVVLSWREPTTAEKNTADSPNKVRVLSICCCYSFLRLPPPARGGGPGFDGRLVSLVWQLEASFVGSWSSDAGKTLLSPSRRHGGNGEKLLGGAFRPCFRVFGVEMP